MINNLFTYLLTYSLTQLIQKTCSSCSSGTPDSLVIDIRVLYKCILHYITCKSRISAIVCLHINSAFITAMFICTGLLKVDKIQVTRIHIIHHRLRGSAALL